jgi:uncharacterized membrane protein
MESKAKVLGHPIHPMLIVLPLGLFISAVVFDALYLWNGSIVMAAVGFWNIAGGVIGGLLAAVFGSLTGSRFRPVRAPSVSGCCTERPMSWWLRPSASPGCYAGTPATPRRRRASSCSRWSGS